MVEDKCEPSLSIAQVLYTDGSYAQTAHTVDDDEALFLFLQNFVQFGEDALTQWKELTSFD